MIRDLATLAVVAVLVVVVALVVARLVPRLDIIGPPSTTTTTQ